MNKKNVNWLWITCLTFLITSGLTFAQEPKEVVVHHSDSTHMSLQECNDWHRARGWDSCGYHFIIEPTGEIVPARPINKKGAHCRGHNNLTGVVFVGKDTVNQSQVSAFWRLMAKLGHPKFYGHRDMSGAHTECPGEKIWKELKQNDL